MQQTNLFDLHNATLKISYSSSSLNGQPQLSYQKGATTMNFHGNQLRQKSTEIGALISVTLKNVPDLHSIVLSLLLPQVNIPTGQSQVQVSIKAIETTIRTSIESSRPCGEQSKPPANANVFPCEIRVGFAVVLVLVLVLVLAGALVRVASGALFAGALFAGALPFTFAAAFTVAFAMRRNIP